jgi:4-hydroxy-4-methyl-2-oxoglutarate aldolase
VPAAISTRAVIWISPFSHAASCPPATARGRVVEPAQNTPVNVGGVVVAPGDFVIADGSGVAFIVADRISQVVDLASNIAAREAAMSAALREGKLVSEVMGADYENMLKRKR